MRTTSKLRLGLGYDHDFVLDHPRASCPRPLWSMEPTTGRTLRVLTTEPGVQLYTGNHLDGSITGSRACLQTTFRILPGNAAFSGLSQPSQLPHD